MISLAGIVGSLTRAGRTAPLSSAPTTRPKTLSADRLQAVGGALKIAITNSSEHGARQMALLQIRCPLTPTRVAKVTHASERITPETALDLERLLAAISPEVILRFRAGRGLWGIVSPIASYGSSHVMVTNLDRNRYVAGAESLTAVEGDEMFRISIQALGFLSQRTAADNVSLGYNWSEFSWGVGLEEQAGFASMPTKFHLHAWARPAPPEEGKQAIFNDAKTEWVREEDLSPQLYRLLVKNDYGVPLGGLLAAAIGKALGSAGPALITELANPSTWSFDARGACATLKRPLLSLGTDYPRLFSRVIQPIARATTDVLNSLTETFTDMNCSQLRSILKKVEYGLLSTQDLATLRAVPKVRPEDEISSAFRVQNWPAELLPVLLPAVRERCSDPYRHDSSRMWRKGFGYALVLSGPAEGPACELRIMPGVYLGAGGVVEAQRIVLSRVPIPAPHNELVRRSRMMSELGRSVATE
jgi:hypothetical protein